MRILAEYKEGEISIRSDSIIAKIPDYAKIIITTKCGECSFIVRGAAGHKLSCGHPKIQAARPYVNDGGNSRCVVADHLPDWCPL